MRPSVKGRLVDEQTRCVHYHTQTDIIAIKFKCCNTYYPCYYCHEEVSGHNAEVWKKEEFNINAVLCGSCRTEMSINAYKDSGYKCPSCEAAFNSKCANHYHLYFET